MHLAATWTIAEGQRGTEGSFTGPFSADERTLVLFHFDGDAVTESAAGQIAAEQDREVRDEEALP